MENNSNYSLGIDSIKKDSNLKEFEKTNTKFTKNCLKYGTNHLINNCPFQSLEKNVISVCKFNKRE